VLIVGGGAREHALAWKLAQSDQVDTVLVAPGSDAIATVARCFADIRESDSAALIALCLEEAVGLVVIGPENPLAAGLTDRLRDAGITVFGPAQAAARLESSKAFAKRFMARHDIPTGTFAEFLELDDALGYVRKLGGPCVVKADGLAAGKGVFVCDGVEDAEAALGEIMTDRRFGEAGARVVVEERMEGEEASYYAITDGEHIITLAAAQDHKRALDGDEGENTGGMGAYSPAPVMTPGMEARVMDEIIEPTVRAMKTEGQPFKGVLYAGLMITEDGPQLIEFNVRFGDPECQVLMPRLKSDLLPALIASADGVLANMDLRWRDDAAMTVVLAAQGYPGSYQKGDEIHGLAAAGALAGVTVFHAGTKAGDGAKVLANGGRVLGVTATAPNIGEARARAYAAVEAIDWPEGFCRRDIGWRAVEREKQG